MHDSALLAFGLSLGSTAALVGLGYGLYSGLPDDPDSQLGIPPNMIGVGVMITGAMIGPIAGNLTLGAWDDVRTGLVIKTAGMLAGGVMLLVGLSAGLASYPGGCGSCDTMINASVVMVGAGLAAGAVYDLVTIPGNAERASARRAPTVSLAPASGAAGLGLRVAF